MFDNHLIFCRLRRERSPDLRRSGTSAKLPIGTVVKSYLDEDVPLEIAAVALPPLTVTVPAPVVAAGATVAPAVVATPVALKSPSASR